MTKDNAVLARNTENAPKSSTSSQSVAFSHYNNLSAQLPIDPQTNELVSGGIKEQAVQCFNNIKAIIESIDHRMSDVIRISLFVKNLRDLAIIDEVYQSFFPTYLPARTVVAVADLPQKALIQVEALVSNGVGSIPDAPQAGDLIKLVNNTSAAPLDPLSSQTVAFSHYNNLTAQLPIDPKTGRVIQGCVKRQTQQCLENIKTILESIDVPVDDVVKVTIFVKKLAHVAPVDKVYSRFFPDSAIARAVGYVPARSIMVVEDLPLGAAVQIEAVVSHGDGTPPQEIEDRHGIILEANNTKDVPMDPMATQTVAFSHYNNLSAQLPIDVATGELVAGGIKEQTQAVLQHVKTIIESVDHVMEDVVKINIALTNLDDIEAMEEIYATFFPTGTPAKRIIGVSDITKGALIQVDAIVGNAEGTPPII